MIQTFWLVKSHKNFPSVVLLFNDHSKRKSPKHISNCFDDKGKLSLTKEVEASDRDHQVEIGAIEAATRHAGQPEQEAEAEECVEAGGEGAAAGLIGEELDHDDTLVTRRH